MTTIVPDTGAERIGVDELLRPEVAARLTHHTGSFATGFEPLDTTLEGGIQPEELAVVAGMPGIGKTISLLQWSRHMARNGHNVTIASYEHRELAVLTALLFIEIGELSDADSVQNARARRIVTDIGRSALGWSEAICAEPLVERAMHEVSTYADRLQLLSTIALRQGFEALARAVLPDSNTDVLVVDHLQKVPQGGELSQRIASRLKSLAVDAEVAVIAASPIADSGLQTRRLRLGQIYDAAAVSHEADVVIVLNDKLDIVSKNHSSFDPLRAREFRRQTVFSVEKNRRGRAGVDIEFDRDFLHRRFDPAGAYVADTLIDGVLVID